MRVTVCIPTYRRPRALVWSLASVLLQRFDDVEVSRRRVVVINNEAEGGAVERAVRDAVALTGERGWELRVVHRSPPMDPALSWYEGIREHSETGDAVFLHGDDDLVVRDGLSSRVRALAGTDAHVMVNRPVPGTIYFEGAEARWTFMEPDAPLARAVFSEARPVSLRELPAWGPAFIGNNVYRNTPGFWAVWQRTVDRLRTLPLEGPTQLAMLPFFLGIEAAREGTLMACDARAVIRGQSRNELVGVKVAQNAWRPGVLYALCVRLLEEDNRGDPAFGPILAEFWIALADWWVPSMAAHATRADLKRLGYANPRQFGPGDLRSLAFGLSMLAKNTLGVQALRLAIDALHRRQEIAEVLRAIDPDWRLPG